MRAIVVGAGLAGLSAARLLTDAGHDVEVFETRSYLGGNCADDNGGHLHGAHIFHTSDEDAWAFVQRFADWTPVEHRVVADTASGRLPVPYRGPLSDEEVIRLCFDGYTRKMWGCSWSLMPDSVQARVKLRDPRGRYFTDTHEALPCDGYAAMFARMAQGITVHLNCHPEAWRTRRYDTLVWTGRLDDLFMGPRLAFRSLWFQEIPERQDAFVVNECRPERPHIRTVDYSRMPSMYGSRAVREFPAICEGDAIPYYPLPGGSERHDMYARQAKRRGIICLGRLAEYRYYNMDQVVSRALRLFGGAP